MVIVCGWHEPRPCTHGTQKNGQEARFQRQPFPAVVLHDGAEVHDGQVQDPQEERQDAGVDRAAKQEQATEHSRPAHNLFLEGR